MPKLIEKLSAGIPLLQIILVAACGFVMIFMKNPYAVFGFVFVIYLFPLILWRLCALKFPIKEGTSYIGRREAAGSPWFIAYQCQFILNTFPAFEKIMMCIPGLYSFWLRLWGSQIGRNVLWTPSIMVVDRTHLQIDDFAFIGSLVFISSHTIRRKNGRLLLFFKKVHIGSKSILGYGTIVGPGAVIPELLEVRAMSYCFQRRIQGGAEWKL